MRKRLPGTPEPMHLWPSEGGLRLAGDAWGDPAGPLVLLMHGGGQTRHSWRGTGALLGASGYHAVAFDARGHGDSDWAEDGDYSEDAMVRDLQYLIAALGGRPPVLIGASMGGITGLVAAGEKGVDLAGLVLVDVVPRTESQGSERVHAFMTGKQAGFESLDEVAEAVSAYRGTPKRSGDLSGLAKNVRQGSDGRLYWHWDPHFIRTRNWEQRHVRLEACARNISVPTMLVRGGGSDVVTEEGVRQFLNLCPHAEYVNVAEAGHMVTGERNDKFGRAAIGFLSRTVPPGSD